jgi:hypothetical protein
VRTGTLVGVCEHAESPAIAALTTATSAARTALRRSNEGSRAGFIKIPWGSADDALEGGAIDLRVVEIDHLHERVREAGEVREAIAAKAAARFARVEGHLRVRGDVFEGERVERHRERTEADPQDVLDLARVGVEHEDGRRVEADREHAERVGAVTLDHRREVDLRGPGRERHGGVDDQAIGIVVVARGGASADLSDEERRGRAVGDEDAGRLARTREQITIDVGLRAALGGVGGDDLRLAQDARRGVDGEAARVGAAEADRDRERGLTREERTTLRGDLAAELVGVLAKQVDLGDDAAGLQEGGAGERLARNERVAIVGHGGRADAAVGNAVEHELERGRRCSVARGSGLLVSVEPCGEQARLDLVLVRDDQRRAVFAHRHAERLAGHGDVA